MTVLITYYFKRHKFCRLIIKIDTRFQPDAPRRCIERRLLARETIFRIRLFCIVIKRFYCTADLNHTPPTTHHSPFTILQIAFAHC